MFITFTNNFNKGHYFQVYSISINNILIVDLVQVENELFLRKSGKTEEETNDIFHKISYIFCL